MSASEPDVKRAEGLSIIAGVILKLDRLTRSVKDLGYLVEDVFGPRMEKHCQKIIKEVGRIPVTQAIITVPRNLPYKGIIHEVGPCMGDGDEQVKIEKTIINSLRQADRKCWQSVAFPAISIGLFGVPSAECAKAFKRVGPLYWKSFPDTSV